LLVKSFWGVGLKEKQRPFGAIQEKAKQRTAAETVRREAGRGEE
jgi:hypothetical protein